MSIVFNIIGESTKRQAPNQNKMWQIMLKKKIPVFFCSHGQKQKININKIQFEKLKQQ